MENSSSDIAGGTRPLPTFAQFLSIFGYILIIVGVFILIGQLRADARSSFVFEPIRVVADASIMLCGVVMVICGQALAALRSIARNCTEKSE